VPRALGDRIERDRLDATPAGEPQPLADLYDRHAASLFRHALALAGRRADAEDLVQAVFVKLATTDPALPGVRQPASYLHRMLHTTWIDMRRRTVTGERVVAHLSPERTFAPDPAHTIDLDRAVAELPPEQREVVVLHLVEGFSFRDVGRQTGVSVFTAAARYRLAIRRLRKTLASTGDPR
jgi:RNA polymerase sigma-70 factor (ECF subfamily)